MTVRCHGEISPISTLDKTLFEAQQNHDEHTTKNFTSASFSTTVAAEGGSEGLCLDLTDNAIMVEGADAIAGLLEHGALGRQAF